VAVMNNSRPRKTAHANATKPSRVLVPYSGTGDSTAIWTYLAQVRVCIGRPEGEPESQQGGVTRPTAALDAESPLRPAEGVIGTRL